MGLHLGGFLTGRGRCLVDHLPKLIGSLRQIGLIGIVSHGELGTEKEVADRVLVQNAVDEDPLGVTLEVDAVIAAAKAVQGTAVTLDLAEVGSLKGIEIIRQDLKLGQKVELEILGKGTHFRRACGIEDDLKHSDQDSGKRMPSATAS